MSDTPKPIVLPVGRITFGPAKEPSLLVLPPRGRGRPRLDDPMVPVSTRLPSEANERLLRLSYEQRRPVSSVVRSLLMMRLPAD